jgi:uncharacterized protein YerC
MTPQELATIVESSMKKQRYFDKHVAEEIGVSIETIRRIKKCKPVNHITVFKVLDFLSLELIELKGHLFKNNH